MCNKHFYEDRYVAFIDILGFRKKILEDNVDNNKNILEVLNEVKQENYDKHKINNSSIGVEVSLFSDSLIISWPIKDSIGYDNLFNLIMNTMFIQFNLAFKGVFVRGAITKGKLYHDKDICFGEALLEAENLEKSAIYPRVIVPDEILTQAIKNNVEIDKRYSPHNDYESEAEYFYRILKKDIDGIWYVNFILQSQEFDDGSLFISMLEKIKEKCEEVLSNSDDEHIRMKYNWLKNKLVETVNDKNLSIPIIDEEEVEYYRERLSNLGK